MNHLQDRRFIYCGFSLKNNMGHHANMCRQLVGEITRRAIPTNILAPRDISPQLAEEWLALPYFRISTSRYPLLSSDPLCGMLTNFFLASNITMEDLMGLKQVSPNDLIYFGFAQPYQIHACIAWAETTFAPGQAPHFVFELGSLPGMVIHPEKQGAERYTLHSFSPSLFRYTLTFLPPHLSAHFHFMAITDSFATLFSEVLGKPVSMAPMPQTAVTPPRHRRGACPITISFLGYQSREKGYPLVPELAEKLLARHGEIRILVYDSSPDDLPEITNQIRQLADQDPRLRYLGRPRDPAEWESWISSRNLAFWGDLLNQTDLLVLPYTRGAYATLPSGVSGDGIAQGIPQVLPGDTIMANTLKNFGNGGIHFDEESVGAILEAVEQALIQFNDLAERAYHGSQDWAKSMGSGPFVDKIFSLAGWD